MSSLETRQLARYLLKEQRRLAEETARQAQSYRGFDMTAWPWESPDWPTIRIDLFPRLTNLEFRLTELRRHVNLWRWRIRDAVTVLRGGDLDG